MRTKLGNIRWSQSFTRSGVGFVLGYGFVLFMQSIWVQLARTEDWVLEYRAWLVYGERIIGLAIFVGCLLQGWSKPLRNEGRSRGT